MLADSREHVQRVQWLGDKHLWTAQAHEVEFPGTVDLKIAEELGEPPTKYRSNGHAKPVEPAAGLRYRTAQEISASTPDEPAWVHEGTLVAGAITEIDGKAKLAGKTTFLGHEVRACLEGLPFMGKPTKAGPWVWLTEENDASFKETLKRCHLTDRADLHVLTYADTVGTDWSAVVASARAKASEVQAVGLTIDTLPRFAGLAGEEENSSGAAMKAMDPVLLAAKDGLAVVISRHDRRAGGEVGESGRGSTAFTGSVDIVLHINRVGGDGRTNLRELSGVGRFPGIPEKLILELREEGYLVLGSEDDLRRQEAQKLLLEYLPETEEEAVTLPSLWIKEREATDKKQAIQPGPLADTKLSRNTFYRAADELVSRGLVGKREISARRTVWWCESHARGGLGYTQNDGPLAASGRDESHRVLSPLGEDRGTHTGQPCSNCGHSFIETPECPGCGEVWE